MKQVSKVFVDGKLPSINDYIDACRANKYKAAKMKREAEDLIIAQTLQLQQITRPVFFRFTWYEKTTQRDPDNVCAAKKFILDALQKSGKLKNDNAKWVRGFAGDMFIYGIKQGVLIEVLEVIP